MRTFGALLVMGVLGALLGCGPVAEFPAGGDVGPDVVQEPSPDTGAILPDHEEVSAPRDVRASGDTPEEPSDAFVTPVEDRLIPEDVPAVDATDVGPQDATAEAAAASDVVPGREVVDTAVIPDRLVPDSGADVPPEAARDVATCGTSGSACCPGRVCNAGLGCTSAGLCGACGGRGQPCCWAGPGSLCGGDLTCRGVGLASTCECGNPGEACCPGYTCNTLPGTVNTCRVVGTRRVCG